MDEPFFYYGSYKNWYGLANLKKMHQPVYNVDI